MELISPEYQEQLRLLHASRVWGAGGHKYADAARQLACAVGAADVLDYGCGAGTLKPALADYPVREFDPGIIGKDGLPDPADLVVCSDVLEHIEPHCLDAVLDHLFGLTRKACFAVIATRPAHKTLPNGRNAHLIVRPVKWWLAWLGTKPWNVNLVERFEDQIVVHLVK